MRILIIVESATIGGHVITALTTARALRRRGHEITVATGDGPLKRVFADEFSHYCLPFYYDYCDRMTYFSLRSIRTVQALRGGVLRDSFDMIHAFDARSFLVAYLNVALFKKTPITATICGGVSPFYNIPSIGKLIVFSKEQLTKMVEVFNWKSTNLVVVRNRINTSIFDSLCVQAFRDLSDLGIDKNNRIVMLVTTFLEPKVLSIKQALSTMSLVLKKNVDTKFVIVGGKGDFYNQAIKEAEEINNNLGRKAIVFTGLVENAYRYLAYADVVLGQGRSAFEGMGFGKPTIIIGENGFAGTVLSENVESQGYYNFSGRNQLEPVSSAYFASEISKLLSDSEYAKQCSAFAQSFLAQELDIEAGIKRIEDVYELNRAWFRRASRVRLWRSLVKSLGPILFDNYYNALKRGVLKR